MGDMFAKITTRY